MTIQPYLFFNGRCEEALNFYREKLGARVDMLMRFKENPDKGAPGCDHVAHVGDVFVGALRSVQAAVDRAGRPDVGHVTGDKLGAVAAFRGDLGGLFIARSDDDAVGVDAGRVVERDLELLHLESPCPLIRAMERY